MKLRPWLIPISGALLASLWSISALADADKVVIGDSDDMSGLYADVQGPGAHRSRQDGDRRFRRVGPG